MYKYFFGANRILALEFDTIFHFLFRTFINKSDEAIEETTILWYNKVLNRIISTKMLLIKKGNSDVKFWSLFVITMAPKPRLHIPIIFIYIFAYFRNHIRICDSLSPCNFNALRQPVYHAGCRRVFLVQDERRGNLWVWNIPAPAVGHL